MLNKDSWTLGAVLGLLAPLTVYGIILLILIPYDHVEGLIYQPRPKAPPLAAICSNLFLFRYYMVNKKFDRTGRAILLLTFAYIMFFFLFFS